jgi:hypothetical protein
MVRNPQDAMQIHVNIITPMKSSIARICIDAIPNDAKPKADTGQVTRLWVTHRPLCFAANNHPNSHQTCDSAGAD